MKTITLYQLSSIGRLKHLVLTADGNTLKTEWLSSKDGVDGERQETSETIYGKNEGKANETSDEEQTVLEWERKVKKKKEEGYVETIEEAMAVKILDVTTILPKEFAPSKPISNLKDSHDPFDGTWLAERKWDGSCILLHRNGEEAWIYSRRIADITEIVGQADEVKAALAKVPENTLMIGELVAIEKGGKENNRLLKGITNENTEPAKSRERYLKLIKDGVTIEFKIFDVIVYRGDDVTKLTFTERREITERYFGPRDIRVFTKEWDQEARDAKWEGFILRQDNDTIEYTMNGKPRRAGSYKHKFNETDDVIVVGFSAGSGKHSDRIARFLLAQYKHTGEIIDCGFAGPGQLGEAFLDELTKNILAKGYSLSQEIVMLKEEDWMVFELEFATRQGYNKKSGFNGQPQNCFQFPVLLRERTNDKPLKECILED